MLPCYSVLCSYVIFMQFSWFVAKRSQILCVPFESDFFVGHHKYSQDTCYPPLFLAPLFYELKAKHLTVFTIYIFLNFPQMLFKRITQKESVLSKSIFSSKFQSISKSIIQFKDQVRFHRYCHRSSKNTKDETGTFSSPSERDIRGSIFSSPSTWFSLSQFWNIICSSPSWCSMPPIYEYTW